MAALFKDGDMPYGTRVLTIGGYLYICDDWLPKRGSNLVERSGVYGQITGWVLNADSVLPTGTATLQLETTTTPLPTVGQSFVEDSETWVIQNVENPESKESDKKVHVTFVKDVNANS